MLKEMLYIITLVLGFPAGLILASLCKDEIKSWRKRLIIINVIFLILAIGLGFISSTDFKYTFPVILTLLFIIITNLTIIWKS